VAKASARSTPLVHVRRRRRARTTLLYAAAIFHEFRWTLAALAALILIGALLYHVTPLDQFSGRPGPLTSVYGAWMAMLAQPLVQVPRSWHLGLMQALYPVLGFILIGEGVVRLALLLMSRRQGEKEWMHVMASVQRDHVVLCGLGHLGYRVFEHLVASQVDVVVVEIDENNRFLAAARATGACILVRDMKDDQALIAAGIQRAAAVVIATNDDMANLEVAVDSRRLNKNIRIVLRLFDQQIAQKLGGAMTIDAAFSASALAAPIVAAMSLRARVLATTVIGGLPHMISELVVDPGSPLAGQGIDRIEQRYATKILARTPRDGVAESPPSAATTVAVGDVLVAHTAASRLTELATAAGRAAS
jgi:Trk K+ transport system NAD-binding subunit